jgi:hypothetical protein
LYEPVNFVLIVNEKVHEHLGEQRFEKCWPDDCHGPIIRLAIVKKTRELEKHFA